MVDGQRMAQRNQIARTLGRLDARDARGGKHVAFRNLVSSNEPERFLHHPDFPASGSGTLLHWFSGDIDHLGFAFGVNVR